jgi:hypothetical protein
MATDHVAHIPADQFEWTGQRPLTMCDGAVEECVKVQSPPLLLSGHPWLYAWWLTLAFCPWPLLMFVLRVAHLEVPPCHD